MTEITTDDLKQLKIDIREFFALSIENVLKEVSRLSGLLERTDQAIRNIELNTNTRIATMQKDIDNLYEELDAVKKYSSLEKEEGARQSADLSLQNEIRGIKDELKNYKESQDKKWTDQTIINTAIGTITKLLWMVIGIILTVIVGAIINWIISGGLRGLVTP